MRFALSGARRLGAEPGRVTLAGYGWGRSPRWARASTGPWKQVPVPPSECSVPLDTAPEVRAVVGLVGDFDHYAADDPRPPPTARFAQVTASPAIPVRLVQGIPDQLAVTPEETATFAAALAGGRASGHDDPRRRPEPGAGRPAPRPRRRA